MHNHQQLILIYLHLLHLFVYSSTSRHPNHLKPFGLSGPFEQIHELTDNFPDPIIFFDKYVSRSRPVLFRQVLIKDPHLSLWNTDEKLNKIFSNTDEIVHVETRKKESRKQDILTMTMTEFLNRYQNEELYLVEEVPKSLRSYFILPTCLQCQSAVETFQVAMLWFSSGNTSSVVHTDDYDNINCVLQGDKQFILLDPHKYKQVASEIIDNHSGSFSSMDVDRVDFNKYPSLANDIHYYQVNLTKGDCLFIPALWIHQVRSQNRNIAVNYWLNHQRVLKAIVNKKTCLLMNKSDFMTLETIQWPKELSANTDELKRFMLDLVDGDIIDFKEWTNQFSTQLNFELQSNVRTITLFAEFFNMIDINENGVVTSEEIEYVSNNNILIAYEILQDILELIDNQSDNNNESSDISTEEEVFYTDHRINETLSGDESDEEEQDNLLMEHEDL